MSRTADFNYTVGTIIYTAINYHNLKEQRLFKTDFEKVSDMLIDFWLIINRAELTDKQLFVLNKHYMEGYTQDEVGKMLGTTQQMCEKHSKAVKRKIKRVLIEMKEVQTNE